MYRVEAVWTGGPMGTGLSVINLDSSGGDPTDLNAALPALRTFFVAAATLVPPIYTIAISNVVEQRNEETGLLEATHAPTAVTPVTGTAGTPAHSAGVGIRARWVTNGIRNGRLVIGTTFIVPIVGNAMESNGTIQAANITTVQNAGTTLISALATAGCQMVVWSRKSVIDGVETVGQVHPVTTCSVPDQAAWLTTRRS